MGDDDFNLDELINAHSTRVVESDSDSVETKDESSLAKISDVALDDFEISADVDFSKDISLDELDDEVMLLDSMIESKSLNSVSDDSQISTLADYSRFVLEKIERENLPTTPENYQIYFTELLPTQNEPFQESVYKLLSKESLDVEQQKSIEFEESVDKSLKLTEQLLKITTKVHGNINIMRNIIYKRDNELTNRNSADIVKLLKFDLSKLEDILKRQSGSMKNIYSRSVEAVNSIHEKTIFDTNFGIYNRRYFLESLNNEMQKMEYFNYQSSIALIIPHKTLTSKHVSPKIAFVILKTISNILLEHFKRNDVISYYGNNIFGVLLTRSNLDYSEEKIHQLVTALKSSSLFIGGKEINLKVKIGLSELLPNMKSEKSLLKALDALKIANKSNDTYYIL